MTTTSKNKLFIFTIAVLLLANIAMIVFFVLLKEPEKNQPQEEKWKNPVAETLKDKVGFNEAQMSRYEQMKQQHKEKMKPLFESMRTAKETFYNYLNNASVPDSTLQSASLAIGEKQQLIDLQIFNHFRNLRTICTTEQQPAYDSLIKKLLYKMMIPGRRGGPAKDSARKKD